MKTPQPKCKACDDTGYVNVGSTVPGNVSCHRMPCQACRPHFAAAATLEWDGPAYELIEAAKKDAFAAGQLDGARKMQEACIQRIRKFWHRPIEGHAGQPYMRTDPTWAEACCKAIDPAQVVQGTPPQEPPK